jgi:hypothetical protein
MTPYLLRLCCLSLAVWFAVQLCVGLLVRSATGRAIGYAERLHASRAAALMLALRWLPALSGLFAAAFLCVPIYIRFEPLVNDEEMGFACVGLACLAVLSFLLPLTRTAFHLFQSELRLQALLRNSEKQAGVSVIRKPSPSMALVGLFRSHVLVSQEVMDLLSSDQLDAALRHERAHKESGDNRKRLLLELAPLDGTGNAPRTAWSRFTEWAADDRATEGDSLRSIALASALVSVARLSPGECLPHATMLISNGRDLRLRVERLLEPSSRPPVHRFPFAAVFAGAVAFAAALALLVQQPSAAAIVHGLLEALVD